MIAAACAASFSVTSRASAHETYPGVLQSIFKNQCAVQCTLCHTSEEGGTANLKPSQYTPSGPPPIISPDRGNGQFLSNLVRIWSNGGPPHTLTDDDDLRHAITALQQNAHCDLATGGPCDSDGDGTPDTVELARDQDPDVIDKAGDFCVGPKYGCGAHIGNLPHESSATRQAAVVMSLLGVGLVFLRRVRRRR